MNDPYDILVMPWITEKTLEARRVSDPDIGFLQNNNRIEFIVHRDATKAQIKRAVEDLFEVKVAKVNTRITITGKHASVRLAEDMMQRRPHSSWVLSDEVTLWVREHVHNEGDPVPRIGYLAIGSQRPIICQESRTRSGRW